MGKRTEDIVRSYVKAYVLSGSFYPALIAELDCSPIQAPGLNNKFRSMRLTRMELKKIGKGKGPEANLIKLSLNGSAGSFNQENSDIYDLSAFLKITLNGQMYLLMLCEMLFDVGATIDMVNTDGVSFLIKRDLLPQVKEVWDEWQRMTQMELEDVEFECVYRLFGNSYLAVPKSGKPKQKGAEFITDPDLGNSCNFLIVPKTVNEFLLHGTDPKEFIRRPDHHIFDFCASQKVGRDYIVYWGDQKVQRLNRYFISRQGQLLTKYKNGRRSAFNKLKGVRVQLFNELTEAEASAHNLDYHYYDELVNKIIDSIFPKTTVLTLF